MSGFHYRLTLGLLLAALATYQNCAPAGTSNAFVLGTTSSTSSALSTTSASTGTPSATATPAPVATATPAPVATATPAPTAQPTATPSTGTHVWTFVSNTNSAPTGATIDPTCLQGYSSTIGTPAAGTACTVAGSYCTEYSLSYSPTGIVPPGYYPTPTVTFVTLTCK